MAGVRSDLRRELQQLIDEDAPASVVVAAEEAVRCAEQGLPANPVLGDIIMDYAKRRATQNRYGK